MRRGSVVMLIEIIIAAAIVLFVAQLLLRRYSTVSGPDGSPASPAAAIDAARSAVDLANGQQERRLKELNQAF